MLSLPVGVLKWIRFSVEVDVTGFEKRRTNYMVASDIGTLAIFGFFIYLPTYVVVCVV